MKKLGFEKFLSSKITTNQLKDLKGGECTGGGSELSSVEYEGEPDCYRTRLVYSTWSSDDTSTITGDTTYRGVGTTAGRWQYVCMV